MPPRFPVAVRVFALPRIYRKRKEPGASPYHERIKSLKDLHQKGCKTWVSIEPYPTPNLINQDITEILKKVSFADKIIFGRTNYCKEVSAYPNHKQFYNEQAQIVIDFCKKYDIAYHIKKGTITTN